MPELKNRKHELFAQELAKGASQLAAYKTAGYQPNDAHASRLAGQGRIRGRLAELQSKAAAEAVVTVQDIARQLDEDRTFARGQGHSAAAVAASMGKAKILGLIVDRVGGADGGAVPYDVTMRFGASPRDILFEKLRTLRERMEKDAAKEDRVGQDGARMLPAPKGE